MDSKPAPDPKASPPSPPEPSSSPATLKRINFQKVVPQKIKTTKPTGKKLHLSKGAKITLVIVAVLLLPVLASIYPVYKLLTISKGTQTKVNSAVEYAKAQDLAGVQQSLSDIHSDFSALQAGYKLLFWWQATPLRWHYQDGQRGLNAALASIEAGQVLIAAIEPYTDVLGLAGEGSFTGGTTEDRIVAILETFDKIKPSLDEAHQKLEFAQSQVSQIDSGRYPFKIKGQPVNGLIDKANDLLAAAVSGLEDAKPIIEVLPTLAGVTDTQRYLVLFQNDAELRPTGGFMTAYAIMDVTRGTIVAERSVDIYSLDAKFTKRLEPPAPIKKYFPLVYYWYLRDMNLSPDFKDSMDTFSQYYQQVPGEPEVDGIIAIDTNVLKDLVGILGPIDVPGYGAFSSDIVEACDCPDVIYKLENMITRPTYKIIENRKAVLGPMMQVLLQKAFDAESNKWPELFQTMFANISQKHILFYMKDVKAQEAAERINIAGRLQDTDSDYLHINNANFGGAKSNMFITQEVSDDIELGSDGTTHHLTITYKNPFVASNCNLEAGQLCLNGVLRDFTRIYLPAGSQLLEDLGFEPDTVQTYDELGKTVIEGFFKLQPQSQAKLKLTYKTPYQPTDTYQLLIQKQPGTYNPQYLINFAGQQQELELLTDRVVKFSQ